MDRFYWLIEDSIAGCSRPGGQDGPRAYHGPGDQNGADAPDDLDRDLAWLRDHEIGAVLSLTETPLSEEALERFELKYLHLPVPDMTAPFPEQFQRALDFIDAQRALGRSVVVHCKVGQGRTATILAAYLIRSGLSADEAIARLRAVCPGAIGAPEQEKALAAFADRRDWVL